MAHRAPLLGCLLVGLGGLLTGCGGCEDEAAPPPVRASALSPIETKRVSLQDRRAARKIDPAKKLTTDAAGVTQCGADLDCFVLTAERCVPAVLDHAQVVALFGVVQRVAARYTIVGEVQGGCEVHRELQALELTLMPELTAALRKKGKTDADIAKIKSDGYAQLVERNPPRLSCVFSTDALLEAALDLTEGKYDPRLWRDGCTPLGQAEGR